jgi:hypothetical protein
MLDPTLAALISHIVQLETELFHLQRELDVLKAPPRSKDEQERDIEEDART